MRAIVLGGLIVLLVVSISLGWFYIGTCAAESKSCTFGACCEGLQCCSDKTCKANCCTGTIRLSVTPEKALVNDTLSIAVSGLTDCAAKNISIKDNGAVVCTIDSGKNGGECAVNAPYLVGTHVYTAELDINMDGNISANEQISQLVSIEDRCSGNVSLVIPSSATPGSQVTAQLVGITGCSDRKFNLTIDSNSVCLGNISNNVGACNFTAPSSLKDYIVKVSLDVNKDGTIDSGESAEKVLTVEYICSGTLSMSMLDTVSPNATVNATISGYSHCEGKKLYLKQNNCSGAEVGNCNTAGTGCYVTFTAPSNFGNYTYASCLDMNANTIFETGEQASRVLKVGCVGNISLSLSPSTAEPNATVNATISNLSGCSGKIVNVSINNTLQCQINLSAGSYCSFAASASTGSYVVNAKIDKDDNNSTADEGESTNATLTVATVLHFLESRLTSEGSDQINPKIQGTKVVYEDYRANTSQIYSFALGGSETQITNDNNTNSVPAVWASNIVWNSNDGSNFEVYRWDGATATDLSNNSFDQKYPKIYENTVVWQDNRNGNWDIYSYNLGTATETVVSSATGDQIFPAVWGSKIVWADYRNGNADIYMWDGYEIVVSNATGDQSFPAVYGANVVYQDNRNSNNDIYMWNGSAETRITNNPGSQERPSIYGNYIVWQDNRNGNWDIYVYDLARKTETRLTNNSADQKLPIIYGDNIVFQDNRNGNWDVYTIALS